MPFQPYGSPALLSSESAADSYYNFPGGTMAAIGMAESSQGTDTGTIGNIFQVLPSTAASPGYGLSALNGNDPMDAGAYLSALLHGPAKGNLATAISMYHGGAGNPTPYGNSSPVSSFLQSIGMENTVNGSSNGSIAQSPLDRTKQILGLGPKQPLNFSPSDAVTSAVKSGISFSWLRLVIGIIAIMLISVGVVSLAGTSKTVVNVAKAVE